MPNRTFTPSIPCKFLIKPAGWPGSLFVLSQKTGYQVHPRPNKSIKHDLESNSGYKGFRNGLPGSKKGNFLNTQNSFVDQKWYTIPNGGSNPPNRIMGGAEVYWSQLRV